VKLYNIIVEAEIFNGSVIYIGMVGIYYNRSSSLRYIKYTIKCYYNDVWFLKTLGWAWRAFKSPAMQYNADVQFILLQTRLVLPYRQYIDIAKRFRCRIAVVVSPRGKFVIQGIIIIIIIIIVIRIFVDLNFMFKRRPLYNYTYFFADFRYYTHSDAAWCT